MRPFFITSKQFFIDKVEQSMTYAVPPTFSRVRHGVCLQSFTALTFDDVASGHVHRLPDKSSAAEPLPTSLLKQVADIIHVHVAPFIVELFNGSLAEGYFPAVFKEAFITPIMKRPGLGGTDVSSYRSTSNLTVLSKLLERLVSRQLMRYLSFFNLLLSLKSVLRPGHY